MTREQFIEQLKRDLIQELQPVTQKIISDEVGKLAAKVAVLKGNSQAMAIALKIPDSLAVYKKLTADNLTTNAAIDGPKAPNPREYFDGQLDDFTRQYFDGDDETNKRISAYFDGDPVINAAIDEYFNGSDEFNRRLDDYFYMGE